MYPNLFVIGAAKSGTSSLHYYLGLHPEVHMSLEKEPHYFSQLVGMVNPRLPKYDDAGYQALFRSDLPVRGESSVTYTFWPHPSGVPEAIASACPDARFIYLVRDPVDRYIAHFNHRVALGTESRTLAEVVDDPDEPKERYLAASSYATQLDQYLKVFDAERILVLDHADLLVARAATLRRAFAFLGVDEGFMDARFEAKVNQAADDRTFSSLGDRVRTSYAYRTLTRAVRPDVRLKLVKPVRSLLSRPAPPRADLSPTQRALLSDKLRSEATRLRALTGCSFPTWTV